MQGLKRAAVLCIVRWNRDYLLLHREREPNRGLFVPVGGKVDAHESPRSAAIRETREEAGIAVDDVRYLGSLVETSPTDYNWWSAVYLAELPPDAPRPQLPECREGRLEWIGEERLDAVPMPATDRYIYRYLAEGKPFAFTADYDVALGMTSMADELSGVTLV